MKSPRKLAAFLLLAVIATGCKKKTPVITPTQAQAPPLPAKPMTQVAALPNVPPPPTPQVSPAPEQPPEPPPEKPKHTLRHKPKPTPATGDSDQNPKEAPKETAPGATQQATAGEPPAASPIGQLSTAGDSSGTPPRHDIEETITSTEKGLNDLKRTLTAAEQETTVQIRTFLTKARQALDQGDLDGAHTLATKAKVLLDELTKS